MTVLNLYNIFEKVPRNIVQLFFENLRYNLTPAGNTEPNI